MAFAKKNLDEPEYPLISVDALFYGGYKLPLIIDQTAKFDVIRKDISKLLNITNDRITIHHQGIQVFDIVTPRFCAIDDGSNFFVAIDYSKRLLGKVLPFKFDELEKEGYLVEKYQPTVIEITLE